MEIKNLLRNIADVPKDKKLIVFDLDGTLTESKSAMDEKMAILLGKLLEKTPVAVIGGGKFDSFQTQLLDKISIPADSMKNLFLFPTTATAFYRYDGNNWAKVYGQEFSKEEKERIFSAFEKVFSELGYKHPEKVYGELVEDRGGEITFSALGQDAPLELKKKWHKENPDTRSKMEELLQKHLPDMEVKVAGLTSLDVTHKGVDKGYGLKQIEKYLNISLEDMLFVGDAFFHEGNDEAALTTGVLCFEVSGPEETKKLIGHLLK